MLRYLDLRAIGWGVLANIGFSIGLGLVGSILAMTAMAAQGLDSRDIQAVMENPWQSNGLTVFFLVVGAMSDVAAAVVAARVAVRLEVYQAVAMMTFVAGVSLSIGRGDAPSGYLLSSIALGYAVAIFGAHREKARKLRRL